jgi:hypothetical protein
VNRGPAAPLAGIRDDRLRRRAADTGRHNAHRIHQADLRAPLPSTQPKRLRDVAAFLLSRAGVAGIILGVLAIDPQTLTAVAVIAFGGCP